MFKMINRFSNFPFLTVPYQIGAISRDGNSLFFCLSQQSKLPRTLSLRRRRKTRQRTCPDGTTGPARKTVRENGLWFFSPPLVISVPCDNSFTLETIAINPILCYRNCILSSITYQFVFFSVVDGLKLISIIFHNNVLSLTVYWDFVRRSHRKPPSWLTESVTGKSLNYGGYWLFPNSYTYFQFTTISNWFNASILNVFTAITTNFLSTTKRCESPLCCVERGWLLQFLQTKKI